MNTRKGTLAIRHGRSFPVACLILSESMHDYKVLQIDNLFGGFQRSYVDKSNIKIIGNCIDKMNYIYLIKEFLKGIKKYGSNKKYKEDFPETFKYYEGLCLRHTKKWISVASLYATGSGILLYITCAYTKV